MRFARIIVWIALLVAFGAAGSSAQAAFPGRNGKIAFEDFFHGNISTVDPDGSNRAILIPVDPTFRGGARYPAWSADGKKIAYENSRIFTANADGTGEVDLGVGYEPAWSPDRTQLVFAQDGNGRHLWIMNANGTGRRQLTQGFIIASEPAWSPDGTTIAFVETELSAGPILNHISLIDPLGGTPRQISESGSDFDHPDWSPDGRKIVYNRGTTGITIMDADGRNQVAVNPPGQQGFQKLFPAWSPDGTKIAYTFNQDIWVVNPDGSGAVDVTNTPPDTTRINEEQPSWQPLVNRPPDCSGVHADPQTLLPPNQKLRHVALSGAADADGDSLALSITGVSQDEPVVDRGGPNGPDAMLGPGSNQVDLRAERDPHGDGRVYRVSFTVSDGKDTCAGQVAVQVPRQASTAAVDSSPPSYDSTVAP